MSGVETLNNGLVWRDGNGQQINIWCDPRLPRDVTRRPITPKGMNLLTKVEELIDHITTQWDVQLLQQTFWEEDVQIIRAVPVHGEMEDVVGWHHDSKGCFSIKSAYRVHRATVEGWTAHRRSSTSYGG